jgi:two-component system sensor histidine kinase RegB
MGLGVFIAETLLGRSGAHVSYHNAPRERGGGAVVTVTWSRAALDRHEADVAGLPSVSAA